MIDMPIATRILSGGDTPGTNLIAGILMKKRGGEEKEEKEEEEEEEEKQKKKNKQ
jgi:hypothetical protein